ncbi:MAG: hypothetical protein QG591_1456 [Planctomycetota bacterium]|nr:hypothetical protein [Planctomycetota bacterium]
MIMKKGLIYIWFVLGGVTSVFGEEHVDTQKIDSLSSTISNNVSVKTGVTNDIERPLLRPIELEKNNAIANDQKLPEPSSNSIKERCLENIILILSVERKKLQELENEYKRLEKAVMGKGNDKNSGIGVNKKAEQMFTSVDNNQLKSSEQSEVVDTASILARSNLVQDVTAQVGSTTVQSLIIKNNQKPEVALTNELNHRLSKVIGDMSLFDLAECFYKLCEFDNALQMYKSITQIDISLDQYTWVQYQIANCYRNMKKYDLAFSEYKRFVSQYPSSDLIEQAKWYIDDINWWKSWYEKNTLANNLLLAVSNSNESK